MFLYIKGAMVHDGILELDFTPHCAAFHWFHIFARLTGEKLLH